MLWDDFLNSDYHDWRGGGHSEDRLDKPGWLAEWLADHHLPVPGTPSEEEIGRLKALRSSMLRIVRHLAAGNSLADTQVKELNRTLAEGASVFRLERAETGFRLAAVPLRADWSGIRAEIAASFCRMLAEGEPSRIRICDNPDCLWVYYDETRNRSKRYCDDKMCGNLMKVRRFRARKKTGNPSPRPK